MDKIINNQGEILDNLSYNSETGLFWWIKRGQGRIIGRPAGYKNARGYVCIKLNEHLYFAHRLAFLFMGSDLPTHVDHINCIKSDNRWCNLREASAKTNQYNKGRGRNNRSGFKGVSYEKSISKWRATIRIEGKNKILGRYESPELAYEAYCKAADKYHRDYVNYG